MIKLRPTKPRPPQLPIWRPSQLPPSRPLNRLHSLPLPLATSNKNILRNLPTITHHADSRRDDLPAASSVEKRGTSSPTVRPAQSSSASCASKRALALVARLEDKACSHLQQRTTPKTPPNMQVKLLEGSSEANVTPVGCAVGPPITGQLTLEGIPILGLVDTGASVTCMGFSVWWQYRAQWGPLKPFEGVVHGAHRKPLQIAGKTQHLNLQWGEARGRTCFIVIIGLESQPCLIGMDIMRPLRVHIDVTNGTATHAQPDPQTIHLNAAQQQVPSPPATNSALLLQTTDIPAETARLV